MNCPRLQPGDFGRRSRGFSRIQKAGRVVLRIQSISAEAKECSFSDFGLSRAPRSRNPGLKAGAIHAAKVAHGLHAMRRDEVIHTEQ